MQQRLHLPWLVLLAGLSLLVAWLQWPAAATHAPKTPRPGEIATTLSVAANQAGNQRTARPAGVPAFTHTTDILVVGAEPEGIAAAVAAARSGKKVWLVDSLDRVGGLYTIGELAALDLNRRGPRTRAILNRGFFEEFHQAVGGGEGFDLAAAQQFFNQVLAKNRVHVEYGWQFLAPALEENRVTGATFRDARGQEHIVTAAFTIDATPDADVAAAAGVPYYLAREDLGVTHPFAAATLMFRLDHIDWDGIVNYLEGDTDPYTGANQSAAWGYAEMFNYIPQDPDVQIRGLNIARQQDGSIIINALQIFNLNPENKDSRAAARARAAAELPGIVNFMQDNLPGFKQATLRDVAGELYIRESRHIIGEYRLTAADVFTGRWHPTAIALGSYPVDLQAAEKGQTGSALGGISPYSIPLGTLVPKRVDNLLVVGKAASFSSIAHGSARTVPVGMATGQAAGVAAAYALDTGQNLRAASHSPQEVAAIRQRLAAQGVDFSYPLPATPEENHWAYPYIQYLRERGLISKGYYNDYRLEETATRNTLHRLFILAEYNSDLPLHTGLIQDLPPTLTREAVLKLCNRILGPAYPSYAALAAAGVIDEVTIKHLATPGDGFTNAQVYALTAGLVSTLLHQKARPFVERAAGAGEEYVTVGEITRRLGARVTVDGPAVIVEKGDRVITMAALSRRARVNGEPAQLEFPPWQDGQKTYLPLQELTALIRGER